MLELFLSIHLLLNHLWSYKQVMYSTITLFKYIGILVVM
jgi:hypothetical protein